MASHSKVRALTEPATDTPTTVSLTAAPPLREARVLEIAADSAAPPLREARVLEVAADSAVPPGRIS